MDEHESTEEQPRALPDSIWREVQNEYARAKRKHGEMTPDGAAIPAPLVEFLALAAVHADTETAGHIREATDGYANMRRLATVGEEFGEVARCLTYDTAPGNLRKELIQLGTMALAWASRLAR